jgi:GNAT superfamily N-acetyltransferase
MTSPVNIHVRPFEERDAPRMLVLMRGLASVERYRDRFRVTERDLIAHGLCDLPRFGAFVAEHGGEVIGVAAHYEVPWTFDLRPVVVLKELFVAEDARGLGVGQALFRRLMVHAANLGATRVVWTVLPDNSAARRFYASAGGAPDTAWEHWTLELPTGQGPEGRLFHG